MGVTDQYGFPYPALLDVPNVPGDVEALAEAVEAALAPIDAAARLPRIVCGRSDAGTTAHDIVIHVGFTPQLVRIVTQFNADSDAAVSLNVGRAGLDKDGNVFQDFTGFRYAPGGSASRVVRTANDCCAGYVAATTSDLHARTHLKSFDSDGFTLTVEDNQGASVIFMWEAYE